MLASLDYVKRANTIIALHTVSQKTAFFRSKSLCNVTQVVSKSDLTHKLERACGLNFASAYSLEGVNALTQRVCCEAKQTSEVNIVQNNVLTQAKALISQCASNENTAF